MRRRTHALAAAVALALASSAWGQYRVDNSRANDANNRIGSGGFNDRAFNVGPAGAPTGNALVTGNVTGGREFRGPLGYTDARAFRGPTAGYSSNNFVRDSAGVTASGRATYNNQAGRTFFGDVRGVNAPVGTQALPGGVGAVPAPVNAGVRTFDSRVDFGGANRQAFADTYLQPGQQNRVFGGAGANAALDNTLGNPGVAPAGTDPAANQPAAGTTPADAPFAAPDQLVRPLVDPGGREVSVLSPYTSLRRNPTGVEAREVPGNGTGGDGADGGPANLREFQRGEQRAQGNLANGPDAGTVGRTPEAQTFTTTVDPNVGTGPDTSTGQTSDVRRPQRPQRPLTNRQYDELERRFERQRLGLQADPTSSGNAALDNVRAQQERLREQRAEEATDPNAPADPGAAPVPPAEGAAPTVRPAAPIDPANPTPALPEPGVNVEPPANPLNLPRLPGEAGGPSEADAPPVIKSFAESAEEPRLKAKLAEAEAALKAGQWASAIDLYDDAARVAPDDPFLRLGRSVAELSAGYYRRAELDLRQALAERRPLAAARYELKSMIAPDRLELVAKELRDAANANPQDNGPLLLLAFLHYNTGDAAKAAGLLDLAAQRAGGGDETVNLLRQRWELNK